MRLFCEVFFLRVLYLQDVIPCGSFDFNYYFSGFVFFNVKLNNISFAVCVFGISGVVRIDFCGSRKMFFYQWRTIAIVSLKFYFLAEEYKGNFYYKGHINMFSVCYFYLKFSILWCT